MISNYIFQGAFKLSMAILSCSALYILLLSFVMSGKNREMFAEKEVFYQRIYYCMLRDLGIAGDGYYRQPFDISIGRVVSP